MGEDARDARKEATRRVIEDVALDLMAAKGFEGADVAEIARRAGISRRTFFRHFRQKSDVVLGRGREHELRLRDLMRARPPRESKAHSVAFTMLDFSEWVDSDRPRMVTRARLIMAHRPLVEHALFLQALWADALAEELASRTGAAQPEIEDRLLSYWGIGAHVAAVRQWTEEGGCRPLADLTRIALSTRIRTPAELQTPVHCS